ncbi:MAG: hypothetical protein JO322_14920 [Candidatus Eremiobacteraeota bacterium]|nr:hypothetical protein [Candidatus Eremiobacteraeota bacterium]
MVPRATAISVPDIPGRLQFPPILVERDPFVADVDSVTSVHSKNGPSSGFATEDQIGIVLPPNAGAQGIPATASVAPGLPIVRGIVLGDAPQALIDLGSGVKVFSIGDQLGNDKITSIDTAGIMLSSGIRLAIVHEPR